MKKISYLTLILFAIIFASCKQNADLFCGDYSYKESGSLIFDDNKVPLISKIGQLDIVKIDDNKNDSIIIIKNEFNGGASTLRAGAQDHILTLKSYTKEFNITIDGVEYKAKVNITGQGEIFNDHIIINEIYSGTLTSDDGSVNETIQPSEVLTVAERNK